MGRPAVPGGWEVKADQKTLDAQRAWLSGIVQAAQTRQFWGTFTIKLEGGEIKLFTKAENLMPPGPADPRRSPPQ